MDNYQSTDVYRYLSSLEIYLKGDLDKFHKLCEQVEREEWNDSVSTTTSPDTHNTSSFQPPTTHGPEEPTSTTYQTTQSPENNIEPVPQKHYFRCTIPHTLTLFSTIDIVGRLIGGDKSKEKFEKFFSHSSNPPTVPEKNLLENIFRHGMVHRYFPKSGLGISYHSTNNDKGLFFRDYRGSISLNVNKLEEIVLDTFERIKNNPSLYSTMTTRFQSVFNNSEQSLIDELGI